MDIVGGLLIVGASLLGTFSRNVAEPRRMALRLLAAVMMASAAALFPASWWVKVAIVLVACFYAVLAVTRWTPGSRSART